MFDKDLLPQLSRTELILPFRPYECIDNVLAPEVAICLIIEDMGLSAHTHSRLRRREKAYEVLRASESFGTLVNTIPVTGCEFSICEYKWANVPAWFELCGETGIFGNDMVESDTDVLIAALKSALRGANDSTADEAETEFDRDLGRAQVINGTYTSN